MKLRLLVLVLALASIASAQAALPVTEAAKPTTTKTTAVISGLDAAAPSQELSPVLIELNDLPERAAVWVQVQRLDEKTTLPVTVKSEFFLRKGTRGVLTVPGLARRCGGEGTWSVEVVMSEGRTTTVLARKVVSAKALTGLLALNLQP